MNTKRTWTALAAAIAALVALPLSQRAFSGTIDAVSGASIKILGGTTTDTSATPKWQITDGNAKSSGTMTMYLNTVNNGQSSRTVSIPVSSRRSEGTSATYTVTGLLPATKYYFWFKVVEGTRYSASSGLDSLKTDSKTSGVDRPTTTRAIANGYVPTDAVGRRLPASSRAPYSIQPYGTFVQIGR